MSRAALYLSRGEAEPKDSESGQSERGNGETAAKSFRASINYRSLCALQASVSGFSSQSQRERRLVLKSIPRTAVMAGIDRNMEGLQVINQPLWIVKLTSIREDGVRNVQGGHRCAYFREYAVERKPAARNLRLRL